MDSTDRIVLVAGPGLEILAAILLIVVGIAGFAVSVVLVRRGRGVAADCSLRSPRAVRACRVVALADTPRHRPERHRCQAVVLQRTSGLERGRGLRCDEEPPRALGCRRSTRQGGNGAAIGVGATARILRRPFTRQRRTIGRSGGRLAHRRGTISRIRDNPAYCAAAGVRSSVPLSE